jgi:septum formation topological specificity factor MinE
MEYFREGLLKILSKYPASKADLVKVAASKPMDVVRATKDK